MERFGRFARSFSLFTFPFRWRARWNLLPTTNAGVVKWTASVLSGDALNQHNLRQRGQPSIRVWLTTDVVSHTRIDEIPRLRSPDRPSANVYFTDNWLGGSSPDAPA